MIRGSGRRLFGVEPTPHWFLSTRRCDSVKGTNEWCWEMDSSYIDYNELWQVISFTGGLLVGRNTTSYRSTSFFTFHYDELWELAFEKGRLVSAVDRSSSMASARIWHKGRSRERKLLAGGEGPDWDEEVMRYVNDCFDQDYNLDGF